MTNHTRFNQLLPVLALVAAGAVPAALHAQQVSANDPWCQETRGDSDRARACEVREYTVPATAATLTVDAAPNGGIKVSGSARRDILVRARVSANARTIEEARALVSRVQVIATADRVSADGPRDLPDREGWSVSFEIAAPGATPLSLSSTNGGISVEAIKSRVEFKTVNGGVKLVRVGGEVSGKTSNGGIDVELDGTTWDGSGLDVETTNGGVRMSIPAAYNAHIEAATNNGGLHSDFPVTTTEGRRPQRATADIGSGGPSLRVRTSNGGVHISRK
ncbi:MAG: hypothetical protein A3H96_25080 [Acidobacteria bacterium RIFCSPLOWO2_02_FULL_67_36]|nr:MAG: hypothetical protein A3H96_25080 [Acidobacteria bacterium RIFCSPLOWO2_02_FULL_67_36]OFW25709.1 MAG: hypothetical protein A3G21_24440 [Acidobacteria bacterium RIFCSPLOWO2_12_FULL_66_21]